MKYMRAFAEVWPEEPIVQQLVAQIPWGHNVRLIDQVKDRQTREWYIQKTIENGWSRSVLEMQIETAAHRRTGAAQTNFDRALPSHSPTWRGTSSKTRTLSISSESRTLQTSAPSKKRSSHA
jgi:predicted nuclease of restriction endonuclease-like (RecB) superfamily